MSQNESPRDPSIPASPATSRDPYVPPTLEPLGRWSAITMASIPGGGLIRKPNVSDILR